MSRYTAHRRAVPSSYTSARFQAVALYVDPDGPYAKGLVADFYDQDRDAGTYDGDLPVVAHPPCGPWGKLAWRCENQDRQTGLDAVAQVRRCGGVLEHPVGSGLFEAAGIPVGDWDNPERETDAWGGYTILVRQRDMGHRAYKDTVLYIVGTAELPPLWTREDDNGLTPVERMGKLERRLTPPAMAWWMADVASTCKPPQRSLEARRRAEKAAARAEARRAAPSATKAPQLALFAA